MAADTDDTDDAADGGPPIPASPLDKDIGEMTAGELRGKIARKAGHTTNMGTPLDKTLLNSVYAFLAGDFHTDKMALFKPDHPAYNSRKGILISVVYEAGLGEPGDDWARGTNPAHQMPEELRKPELLELVEEMADRGDQRDWTPGGDE